HNVRRADHGRVLDHVDFRDMNVALLLVLDREPLLAHCLEMRAARDEMHIVACMREPSAIETADAARPHYCDFHLISFPASSSTTSKTCVLLSPTTGKRSFKR